MKNKNTKLVMILFVLLGASALAWAIGTHRSKKARIVITPPTAQFTTPAYDTTLLQKFEELGKKYDTLKTNYTIKGMMTCIDRPDTSTQQKNVPFVVCKRGYSLYYKMGATETINEDGLYLYIDHNSRRILLSRQKTLTGGSGLQNLTRLSEKLKSEYYELSGSVKGKLQTLSFLNEHHISCKQYTISYDTSDNAIKHLYIRTTDFGDPLNKAKDKIMIMDISQWDDRALIRNFTVPGDVVKGEGDNRKTTRLFEKYELINL